VRHCAVEGTDPLKNPATESQARARVRGFIMQARQDHDASVGGKLLRLKAYQIEHMEIDEMPANWAFYGPELLDEMRRVADELDPPSQV
jgi:hypothetical protein